MRFTQSTTTWAPCSLQDAEAAAQQLHEATLPCGTSARVSTPAGRLLGRVQLQLAGVEMLLAEQQVGHGGAALLGHSRRLMVPCGCSDCLLPA